MTAGGTDTRYVLLVDIVGSRGIEDRGAFERRLDDALEYVNGAEREHIATPFTKMKGIDEFGGVLTAVSPVPDVLAGILDRIHPTQARFAIASGDIDVGAGSETVAEMDGPAFHRASTLLEGVEEHGLYVDVDTGRGIDGVFAAALNLLVLAREGLTERQVEVVLAYERCGTQSRAGEELGLGQQAVSNSLRRADYMRRRGIRRNLRGALEGVYD